MMIDQSRLESWWTACGPGFYRAEGFAIFRQRTKPP